MSTHDACCSLHTGRYRPSVRMLVFDVLLHDPTVDSGSWLEKLCYRTRYQQDLYQRLESTMSAAKREMRLATELA